MHVRWPLPMQRFFSLAPVLTVAFLGASVPVPAQDDARPASASTELLGTVHFATSCSPAVAPRFDRAVALLHSFEFGASIRAFNDILAADSTCAMAHWGVALSRWTNPMAPGNRPAALLAQGRQSAA